MLVLFGKVDPKLSFTAEDLSSEHLIYEPAKSPSTALDWVLHPDPRGNVLEPVLECGLLREPILVFLRKVDPKLFCWHTCLPLPGLLIWSLYLFLLIENKKLIYKKKKKLAIATNLISEPEDVPRGCSEGQVYTRRLRWTIAPRGI